MWEQIKFVLKLQKRIEDLEENIREENEIMNNIFAKKFAELNAKQEEENKKLSNKLENLINFLRITEEDYVATDLLGNKNIRQQFKKIDNRLEEEFKQFIDIVDKRFTDIYNKINN